MEDFWDYAKLVAILGTSIIVFILILLSLPHSRLQEFLLKLFSGIFFTITGFLLLYIISPLDLIPDFIPILGQLDDAAASIAAAANAAAGLVMVWQVRSTTPRIEPPDEG